MWVPLLLLFVVVCLLEASVLTPRCCTVSPHGKTGLFDPFKDILFTICVLQPHVWGIFTLFSPFFLLMTASPSCTPPLPFAQLCDFRPQTELRHDNLWHQSDSRHFECIPVLTGSGCCVWTDWQQQQRWGGERVKDYIIAVRPQTFFCQTAGPFPLLVFQVFPLPVSPHYLFASFSFRFESLKICQENSVPTASCGGSQLVASDRAFSVLYLVLADILVCAAVAGTPLGAESWRADVHKRASLETVHASRLCHLFSFMASLSELHLTSFCLSFFGWSHTFSITSPKAPFTLFLLTPPLIFTPPPPPGDERVNKHLKVWFSRSTFDSVSVFRVL